MQRVAEFLGSLGLGIKVPVPNLEMELPAGIVNMAKDAAKEDEEREGAKQ